MPRLQRVIVEGVPHHVTQRGVKKSKVFFSDNDKFFYLDLFKHYAREFDVEVLAYCLMETHVHHVLVPGRKDSFHRLFRPLHSRYARIVNVRHNWVGHLWQNRFFSCALSESHLANAIKYVELNPIKAGVKKDPREYLWSSARARILGYKDTILTNDPFWNKILSSYTDDWAGWLSTGYKEEDIDLIRENTLKGIPCGDKKFVRLLEMRTGARLHHRKSGRAVV